MIRGRRVSPVEVVEACLRRIEQLNPRLNAIVTLAEDALDLARIAEAAVMSGESKGPLHGVPVTIKDTIETKGLRTTSGSRLRAGYLPASDAAAVAHLKSAGAIVLGKTNVPEMAIPYECDNPLFGPTSNPFDTTRTSGGSSGGEAAAISACLSPAGLGSDLSGSIRVPAHFCGIIGLKPTPGRISAVGHFPPAEGALAQGAVIGPLARRVEDLSLFLEVLTESNSSWGERKELRGRGVAIYLDQESAPVTEETEQTVKAVAAALGQAGLTLIEERPPGLQRAVDLWAELYSGAALAQLRDFYKGVEDEAGPLVGSMLAPGAADSLSGSDAGATVREERDSLRAELSRWMESIPLIIAPVGAVPAFEHGARRVEVRGKS
ncbi:MAG TPA: amidase, partial [Pyrinomonadaceae bacterium]|nr:amidase [Pyrinomonadaceae bacterium]